MSSALVPVTISEMQTLATAVAKSGLFGMKTPEQALALMAIAQAEGMHPAIAARDYHIIQGRPTLKADAMLARFQASGGRVEWHSYTDELCDATISHPMGGTIRVAWDMARVAKAQIKNVDMYKKFPRNMLRSRVVSEGIRTVYPGVVVGIYTPEEVDGFDESKKSSAVTASYTNVSEIDDGEIIEIAALKEDAKKFAEKLKTQTSIEALDAAWADGEPIMERLKSELPEWHEKYVASITALRAKLLPQPEPEKQPETQMPVPA